MSARKIVKIVASQPATDGAGVKINRLTGFSPDLSMDPFLMLDEIRSDSKDDFSAGFPPHPHRGFETVTYMREGGFSHTDSMGNTGTINSGGAQWMTAGSGVIHSEMPMAEADRMHGFQFWLNLPATEKMQTPDYRDIQSEEIVTLERLGVKVRLVAGHLGLEGSIIDGVVTGKSTQALIADISLNGAGHVALDISDELKLQFYVYQGLVEIGDQQVTAGHLAYLDDHGSLEISASEDSGLLLFGGVPIKEPVIHHGPFVMNTMEQIEQAIQDYRDGTLVSSSV